MRARTYNVLFILIAFFNIFIIWGLISYFLKISWVSMLIVSIYLVSAIIIFYISAIIIRIIDRIVEQNKKIEKCMNKEKEQNQLKNDIISAQFNVPELDWAVRNQIADQTLIKLNIEKNQTDIAKRITCLQEAIISYEKLIKDWEKVLNNYKIKNGQPLSEKRRN